MHKAKAKFLILTRTDWAEPPRLRHQVTRLLLAHEHIVTFVERPSVFSTKTSKAREGSITRIRHFQPMHHQLKPLDVLQKLYASSIRRSLSKEFDSAKYDGVLNFNYDYGFLRSAISDTPFVTIINDDFEAQAKPWMQSAIAKQLRATCAASDRVLTVSYPLLNRLREFNSETELFLPWSDREYEEPANGRRNVCLYYGYINHRVDFSVLRSLLRSNVRLRVIGPVQGRSAAKSLKSFRRFPNFEYLAARPLESVVLDDVCCSIVPYDTSIRSVQAVTYGNRLFRLLSYGIPVIYPDLPGVRTIPGGAVSTARTSSEFLEAIEYCKVGFREIQPSIKRFLEHHSESHRYSQLINALKVE